MDETGLFYCAEPNKTIAQENVHQNFKESVSCVLLL